MRSNVQSSTLDIELNALLAQLDKLPEHQKAQILEDLTRREEFLEKDKARNTFMGFVHKVWPDFIGGRHHKIMAKAFERVVSGECKRLIINMPPRHTKSEFASYLLPAWFLGKYPHKKVIQSSNTSELAVGFGRKVRNLVDLDTYRELFPGLELRADSKAAGRWNTSKGGDYFAIGPMLPELSGEAEIERALSKEYSSGDDVQSLDSTIALLKKHRLMPEDVSQEADEVLR